MSNGFPIKATREDLEAMIRTVVEKTWSESKHWPNHSQVKVSVRWELDSNDAVVPHITLTGKS